MIPRVFKQSLHSYDRALTAHPLVVKMSTSGFLFGLGDFATQKSTQSSCQKYDMQRTGRMMIWGGLLFAPIGHLWYNGLEKYITLIGSRGTLLKIAADQLIFTPPITAFFFYSQQIMTNQNTNQSLLVSWKALQNQVVETLKVSYMVWPIIHVGTFTYVPLRFQVLYINIMSLGWSSFLSLKANDNNTKEKELA